MMREVIQDDLLPGARTGFNGSGKGNVGQVDRDKNRLFARASQVCHHVGFIGVVDPDELTVA